MVQIFPAVIFGLFTRWYAGPALLIGWAVGMILGTALSWGTTAWVAVQPLGAIPFVGVKLDLGFNFAVYNGLLAVIVNIVVASIISAVWSRQGADETQASDYEDARVAA
jgi:SSS family solute:Na+ symporter